LRRRVVDVEVHAPGVRSHELSDTGDNIIRRKDDDQ
jgi:hypothetical protein